MCRDIKYTRMIHWFEIASLDGRPEPREATAIFATGTKAQLMHEHHVSDFTPSGTGICHSCGLNLWSGAWADADLHGAARQEYMRARILHWVDLVNRDHPAFASDQRRIDVLRTKAYQKVWEQRRLRDLRESVRPAIAAMLNDTEPATLARPGLPVPHMAYGITE